MVNVTARYICRSTIQLTEMKKDTSGSGRRPGEGPQGTIWREIGVPLRETDIEAIVAFLRTLTDAPYRRLAR